ncbi:murein hydrolase activator EnvC family protein [Peribacillus tepidiphilus]|uniref:murein hydrolase activator EnvC family protein n=1 Tax=Peribacillus tepidiphilus TaxID=2652445 RepID=UPI001CDC339B|nr:peptidoglycan DD-metalloendopeptidase family protein [Peribacillus tepidiphilus]
MKKKALILNTVLMLGVGSLLSVPGVNAASISDMESKKQKIQEQRSDVQSDIHNAEKEINRLQNEQEKLNAEIKKLDISISDTNQKIREKNEQIAQTKAEIEKLKAEIEVLKERIIKRNEVLKERARSFQQTGGNVSYLEVLLGATSFSDFIDRVSAISTIIEADQDILRQHEEDKKNLELKQKQVEEKLASLETMKQELEGMKAELEQQRKKKDQIMAQLQEKEKHVEEEKLSLQEEAEILAAQQAAIEKAIQLEKKRRAELEAARKRAAGQAKGNSSSGGSSETYLPPVSSGSFTRPASGRLSSTFGPRWGKFHYGIDIAARGDVPVVSAADGVVVRAYYSSTYGNCVFISHSIDGQIFTTVYAHLDSISVGTGQTVSKGQMIGYMGNTGRSYGQHLHFELHKGPWTASKSNAVDPLRYVPI